MALSWLIIFTACQTAGSLPSGSGANASPPTSCTSSSAIAQFRQLVAALNRGDGRLAASYFPADGQGFVIQPELEVAELDLHATTADEIGLVAQSLQGMGLEIIDTGPATVGKTEFVSPSKTVKLWTVSIGPVRWRASGSRRPSVWGGKVTYNCGSNRFLRVVL